MKPRMNDLATAWKVVQSRPLLAILNLSSLTFLALAAWGWLYLPDSGVLLVVFSILVALLAVAILLTLVSYTFLSYYREHHPMPILSSENIHPKEKPLWRRTLSGLPWLAVWLLAFGILCAALSWMADQSLEWSKPAASWLTMLTQRPVNLYSMNAWLSGFVVFLQWVLLPMTLLAVFAGLAGATVWGGGKRRWLWHSLQLLHTPSYWVLWLLFLAIGLWLPKVLVNWTPTLDGIPAATASLVVRFGAAWLLCFAGWLYFLSGLARLLQYPQQNVIVLRQPVADPS
jgi:hypothetical protein